MIFEDEKYYNCNKQVANTFDQGMEEFLMEKKEIDWKILGSGTCRPNRDMFPIIKRRKSGMNEV